MHAIGLRALNAVVAVLAASAAMAGAAAADDDAAPAAATPTATGTGGAAATVDRLATQAAIDTLRRGGNATDAAVTAAAVLGVTEPFSCGIGGGGFMVSYNAREREVTTIDQRERAPGDMRPDSFWENGAPLAFNDARYSGLSVGVPGTVRGWAEALEHDGTISLAQALAPAIGIASKGFVVDATFAAQTQENVDYFDDAPATAALFLDPDGTPRDVGTVFRNPDLARTYARIASRGPSGFYRGRIADEIVQTVRNPPVGSTANHRWHPGVMRAQDLSEYTAPERGPTHSTYRDLDVYGMGPPSSGGSTIAEALNVLEAYDLAGMTRADALHRELEASRFAFADRGAFLADPDFFDVPLAGLLSKDFAATRRALITDRAAAPAVVAPGDPYPFDAGAGAGAGQASVTATQPGTTTHITTSDRAGNVVSYTFTLESTGASGLVVPGRGFLLNNELTDFNFTSTTHPNRVEGGKRPRSSISPEIVLRDGRPWLALGSPGGSTIITTVLQLLVDRIDLGASLPEAIAAPRASQRNTATTTAESAFVSSPEAAALAARGHSFTSGPEIGAATGIEFTGGRSRVLAAAEPVRRGGGSAMVERPADD
ncbi:MAG: gamma-glutamyltranspeptidase / glutathione hydrolase [Solirubrobacteraceae bacterium]|jgi:gamma-glutamyltranspeptidase/glutathione hydrolase|nr:gamma-glutamyltranspeptidase / glutathione hydrolase [Solirubrobacteraceae bacterium]